MTVYFAQNTITKKIKIGSTNNPIARMRSLSQSCKAKVELLSCIDGDVHLERILQHIFNGYNIENEWFDNTPEIYEFIIKLNSGIEINVLLEKYKEKVEYYNQYYKVKEKASDLEIEEEGEEPIVYLDPDNPDRLLVRIPKNCKIEPGLGIKVDLPASFAEHEVSIYPTKDKIPVNFKKIKPEDLINY